MWIFTKHDFYSAVCARQGDGRYGEATPPEWMHDDKTCHSCPGRYLGVVH
jgi:hypothetical protein